MPIVRLQRPMRLESGQILDPVEICYSISGEPYSDGSNVVIVCPTLTGGIEVATQKEWWFIGPGELIDTDHFCVISMAALGSLHGSSSPSSINPINGKQFGLSFPTVTVTDSVRANQKVLNMLGIKRARALIGGSYGGFCAYTWLTLDPQLFDIAIIFQSALRCSAHTMAAFAFIRELICSDPAWNQGSYVPEDIPSMSGMQEMLGFNRLFQLSHSRLEDLFPVDVRRQDLKLDVNFSKPCSALDKFIAGPPGSLKGSDPNSLLCTLRSSTLFDLERSIPNLWARWKDLRTKLIQIPCAQDWRYPVEGMLSIHRQASSNGVNSQLRVTRSNYGHGSYLYDQQSLGSVIPFLYKSLYA